MLLENCKNIGISFVEREYNPVKLKLFVFMCLSGSIQAASDHLKMADKLQSCQHKGDEERF